MFQPSKILLPIDLEIDNFEALLFAIGLAKQFGAELHCFYVNSPQAGYRSPTVSAEELQERVEFEASSVFGDLRIQYAVSKGDIGNETKEYCDEHEIELVVVTHRHHSRFFSEMSDTRDEEIIDSLLNVPTLILPEDFLHSHTS